eukprot:NODE_140_length_1802_cov_293.622932_g97_i0.p1 GENE.NODE_140_length_1802_cov_293.622932_g97_i0~~NODE_140_length_1802_cov_293.622932_g97_i0.p1  ORF type:complete len:543 (-),score=153.73 NODE_140_length_1802_cov_293.622932_g97_i0:110-1738(-)
MLGGIISVIFYVAEVPLWPVKCMFGQRHKSGRPPEIAKRAQFLEKQLETSKTYDEWRHAARRLDELNGFDEWREQSTDYFDAELARQRLETLKEMHRQSDTGGLMHHIRADLHRGIGGIWNPKMHVYQTGSKRLIEEYLQLIEEMLQYILHHPSVSSKEKYIFFTDLGAAFGHSAMVLSGAAALGLYHVGPVKALHSEALLPRVISGTNTGALVAALVCTFPDSELPALLNFEDDGKAAGAIKFDAFISRSRDQAEGTITRRLRRLLDHGVLMDVGVLRDFLRTHIGDTTFAEAYSKTGRVLNIVCSRTIRQGSKAYISMNYLTTPHVVIWSAACASCAIPGIYETVDLVCKTCEGELEPYCPAALKWGTDNVASNEKAAWDRLSELFNINYFIVSETNINLIPSFTSKYERVCNTLWEVFKAEATRRVHQLARLPFMPAKLELLTALFSKPFEGDVEIYPASSFKDCLKLLNNPANRMAARCSEIGERRTWPKLTTISLLCRIERTLDVCTKRAKQRLIEESPTHLAFYNRELDIDVLNTV